MSNQMSKKVQEAPESTTAQDQAQSAENLAQVAPQSNQKKEAQMSTIKKKAAKPRKATAATNAGNNPATCSNDTTISPVCQGETVGIASWEDVKAQLTDTLRVSIEQAHAEIEEATERISATQAERQSRLAEVGGKVKGHESRFVALGLELSQALTIARHTLSGDELHAIVGQINLAHAAESEKLASALGAAEMAHAALGAVDEAARADEAIELQLYQEHLAELAEIRPELAAQVRLQRSAEQNAHRALEAARKGELAEAEAALDLAIAGEASAELVARAEATLAEANHRAEVRGLIARVQAIDPGASKALDGLAKLAREAEEKGVTNNVVSFINHQKKLAEKTARQRGRERARLWGIARREAELWGENGIPQPGARLEFGPGRIKVFLQNKKGWVLDSIHTYRDGVWQKRSQPARVTVSRLKSKNLVTVK